jgi:hypothetical protein
MTSLFHGITLVSSKQMKKKRDSIREAEGLGWMLPPTATAATTTTSLSSTTTTSLSSTTTTAKNLDNDNNLNNNKREKLDDNNTSTIPFETILSTYRIQPKLRILAIGEVTLLFVPAILFSPLHVIIGSLLSSSTIRVSSPLARKEIELFKQAVSEMYFNNGQQLVVFVERARHTETDKGYLFQMDCLGLPGTRSDPSYGEVIPGIIRHSLNERINENELEEGTNTSLLSSIDHIPPTFPYFYCETRCKNLRSGIISKQTLVHLVNSSTERFPWNLVQDVLKQTMDEMDDDNPADMTNSIPVTAQIVRDLLLKFQPYDWTLNL